MEVCKWYGMESWRYANEDGAVFPVISMAGKEEVEKEDGWPDPSFGGRETIGGQHADGQLYVDGQQETIEGQPEMGGIENVKKYPEQ